MLSASRKLLFGENDKLNFKRSSTHGIARLWTQKAIPLSDHRYWSEYLRIFDSSADVFSLLGVADIRRALVAAPENVATLVEVLILHLESLREDPLLAPLPASSKDGAGGLQGVLSPSALTSNFNLGSMLGSGKAGGGSADAVPRDRKKELLNCCRILTRLLPIIMEGDHDAESNIEAEGGFDPHVSLESDEFENKLLWQRLKGQDDAAPTPDLMGTAQPAAPLAPAEGQFVIDDDDDGVDDEVPSNADPLGAQATQDPIPAPAEEEEEEDLPLSLGERLIEVVVDFLFYSGITLPWTEDAVRQAADEPDSVSRVNFIIWTSGVGSSVELKGTEREHESNRVVLLRLLLVLLSKSIFIPAQSLARTPNPALQYICEALDRSVVLPLLCSLLNTIAKGGAREGWIDGFVPQVMKAGAMKDRFAAVVPGGNTKEHDGRDVMAALCLQIVNVLLNHASPTLPSQPPSGATSPRASIKNGAGPRPSLPTLNSNTSADLPKPPQVSTSNGKQDMFRFYISRLHRAADFTTLWSGLAGILDHAIPSGNQLLPVSLPVPGTNADSSSLTPHVAETLMLLWTLLDHNARFRNFVLEDGYRAPQLLCHLLFFALLNKDSLPQQGLVRLCIFMLEDISSERTFALSISKGGSYPKGKLPTKFAPFGGEGSGADLLIQGVYQLLTTTKGALFASLYSPLVVTLSNTAAFWRGLSVTSSSRLVQLLASFSNPAFLLAEEDHPRLLYYMLEALVYVVQYQFASNPNLTYALCARSANDVRRLKNFSLRRGITEIRRSRRSKTGVNARLAEAAAAASRRQSEVGAQDASQRRESAAPSENASAEASPAETPQQEPSDRVRGKMRQLSLTGSDLPKAAGVPGGAEAEEDEWVAGLDEDELYAAAAALGKNGFVATEEWVASWQRG